MESLNPDDAGSPLERIHARMRTFVPGSKKEPTFAELMARCASTAVHLEIHDAHLTDDPDYQAWLTSRTHPASLVEDYRDYTDVIREAVDRGVRVRRARIVGEPASDYVRWEYELTTPVNVAAGEEVRWLARPLSSALALPGNPYWVFDDSYVRFNVYDGRGQPACNQHTEDPAVVELCVTAFEQVWESAMPHDTYKI
jgi:hypothetical protein